MKITIGFSKPKSHGMLFSSLIRLFEGTDYSHVYIKLDTKFGIQVVYQASGTKVNFMNYDIFCKQSNILKEFTFEISKEVRNEILKFCFQYVGTSYGFKQVIGIAYSRILKMVGIKRNNPLSDGLNTMICSEVVGRIISYIKNDFVSNDFDNMGVKDIYAYLEKENL